MFPSLRTLILGDLVPEHCKTQITTQAVRVGWWDARVLIHDAPQSRIYAPGISMGYALFGIHPRGDVVLGHYLGNYDPSSAIREIHDQVNLDTHDLDPQDFHMIQLGPKFLFPNRRAFSFQIEYDRQRGLYAVQEGTLKPIELQISSC